MKKLICLVLAVMLALSTVSALAEEFSFQGIPWGSSPEEVEAILVENGMIEEGNSFAYDFKRDPVYYPGHDDKDRTWKSIMFENKTGGIGVTCYIDKIQKTIAGQEIEFCEFAFINGFDGETITDDLHLTMLRIKLKEKTAFDALSEQLSAKYGSYETVETTVNNYRVWTGSNNTIIGLLDFGPFLIYANTSDYEKAMRMQAIIEANQKPVADMGL